MSDPRNHPCMAPGCGEWGSFGFATGKDRPLVWYCGEHRGVGEARAAPARLTPEADPVPPTGGQGRLF